jgi:hypothetical protein
MTATRMVGLMLEREEKQAHHRCAWCDQETGRSPDGRMNESHGICPRHLAQLKIKLEREAAQTH